MSTSTVHTSNLHKRLIGVVAAVALALGITAAGAPQAQAATVWDKVAKCESGNNWKINTGNGYYGGLQFSSRTWRGFDGGDYASSAHRATKAEQIAVARRVLAVQGPGAWPTCGRRAALTKSNGKASRNATPASNPGASAQKQAAKKPAAKKSAAKKKPAAVSSSTKTVRVKSGDTIAKIAKRHSVRGGWKGLWSLNKKTVKNPNRIKVGQVLRVR